MRTTEEIQATIDRRRAYLKIETDRLLNSHDPVENITSYATVRMWRDTIQILEWVLQEPVQKMDKDTPVTPV